MARLTLLLLALLTLCALGLVSSRHESRKLFAELEREQERARALEVETGQLQLEAATWAAHARVERIAVRALHMQAPDGRRVQLVPAAPARGEAE
ncbi:MAG: cell division protein FtsL [Burkholderiales bacterium]|nr:cell division protein FtsL [Burkholderiales bacterium]